MTEEHPGAVILRQQYEAMPEGDVTKVVQHFAGDHARHPP